MQDMQTVDSIQTVPDQYNDLIKLFVLINLKAASLYS